MIKSCRAQEICVFHSEEIKDSDRLEDRCTALNGKIILKVVLDE